MHKEVRCISSLFIFILTLCFVLVTTAQAKTYYVDQKNPRASDANPGTKSRPWLSLYPSTRTELAPGDRVVVKPGLYSNGTGADAQDSMISPISSGTSDKPITFVARPRHAVTIEGDDNLFAPIHISSQNHIIIDGFKITNPGKAGIVVTGTSGNPVNGVVIKNNIISGASTAIAASDTDGIRLEYAINATISNNKIHNIFDGALSANASGIKFYNTNKLLINNNEIYNAATGIYAKSGKNIVIRKNKVMGVEYGVKVSSTYNTQIQSISIYENIFNKTEISVQLIPDGGTVNTVSISNNTFVNYSVAALQSTQPGMGKYKIWNNLFDRGNRGADFIGDIFTYDDPPVALTKSEYNLFTDEPIFVVGLYSTNRNLGSLSRWKTYSGNDSHSLVGPANFKQAAKNDFHLKDKSIALLKGRYLGKSRGRKEHIGAYRSGKETIGFTSSHKDSKTIEIAKNKLKEPGKQKKFIKTEKQISSSAESQKSKPKKLRPRPKVKPLQTINSAPTKTNIEKSASVVTGTDAPIKTTVKPKQSTKIELAMVSPTLEKPTGKSTSSKIGWEVRNALKFGGACVLESTKIDFYDGYDNTGLKLRFLNDGLYLVTKSNIDLSFNDVGVQVGKNKLLRADKVVNEQSVIVKNKLPTFFNQLRKAKTAKIQLRFWPSYPATKSYSEVVSLDGFIEAYEAYQACKQGN